MSLVKHPMFMQCSDNLSNLLYSAVVLRRICLGLRHPSIGSDVLDAAGARLHQVVLGLLLHVFLAVPSLAQVVRAGPAGAEVGLVVDLSAHLVVKRLVATLRVLVAVAQLLRLLPGRHNRHRLVLLDLRSLFRTKLVVLY